MNRQQAIKSLLPEKCPTCGGTEFEVIDGDYTLLSDPPQYDLLLRCTKCRWHSDKARWRYDPIRYEVIRSESGTKDASDEKPIEWLMTHSR